MGEKIFAPHSWMNGPPKSEAENWNWLRRCEFREVTLAILRGRQDDDVAFRVDTTKSTRGYSEPCG